MHGLLVEGGMGLSWVFEKQSPRQRFVSKDGACGVQKKPAGKKGGGRGDGRTGNECVNDFSTSMSK